MTDQRLDGPIYDGATAAETISPFRVVAVIEDQAFLANPDNSDHKGFVTGISTGSALIGGTPQIQTYGVMCSDAWAWDVNIAELYFDGLGQLTQTKPATGFIQPVASVLDTNKILVQIGRPTEQAINHWHVREIHTLTGTDISNQFILLGQEPRDPATVELHVQKAGNVIMNRDFAMDDANPKKLKWDALTLAASLIIGDVFEVRFEREG
jgi:hypothetical protein